MYVVVTDGYIFHFLKSFVLLPEQESMHSSNLLPTHNGIMDTNKLYCPHNAQNNSAEGLLIRHLWFLVKLGISQLSVWHLCFCSLDLLLASFYFLYSKYFSHWHANLVHVIEPRPPAIQHITNGYLLLILFLPFVMSFFVNKKQFNFI